MRTLKSPLQIAAASTNGAKSRGHVTPEGKRAAANTAKSTGPVTPEGKACALTACALTARSSRNATRHGLLADSVVLHMVLYGESDDRFCALLSSLEAGLHPEPGIESTQTEIMAIAHWRRMRLWSLEKALFIQEDRKRQSATGDFQDDSGNGNDGNDGGDGDGDGDDGDDGETPIGITYSLQWLDSTGS